MMNQVLKSWLRSSICTLLTCMFTDLDELLPSSFISNDVLRIFILYSIFNFLKPNDRNLLVRPVFRFNDMYNRYIVLSRKDCFYGRWTAADTGTEKIQHKDIHIFK